MTGRGCTSMGSPKGAIFISFTDVPGVSPMSISRPNPKDLEAMHRAHRHEQDHHPSTYDPRAHDQLASTMSMMASGRSSMINFRATSSSWE